MADGRRHGRIAPRGRFPEFLLGGARKCGTTSLHGILRTHPRVYMPPAEIHFFSLPDYEAGRETGLRRYTELFAAAGPEQMIGERSTTYLHDPAAASRIAEILPDAKLIFVLRDPVERAYSHYWHDLRRGRIVRRLPELELGPNTPIIRNSIYPRDLKRYFDLFPRAQIEIVLFEELVRNPQPVLARVFEFLGLPNVESARLRQRNAARVPRSVRLQVLHNRVYQHLRGWFRLGELPPMSPLAVPGRSALRLEAIEKRWQQLMIVPGRYPPLEEPLRKRLCELLVEENREIEALLGIDIARVWPSLAQAES